jgi:phosphoserine aminotransferase
MNVIFRVAGSVDRSAAALGDEALEKKFVEEAAAAGIVGIAGHRSVGGMRVSLYNAVTLEALISFMREFRRTRG